MVSPELFPILVSSVKPTTPPPTSTPEVTMIHPANKECSENCKLFRIRMGGGGMGTKGG